jgi:hypothetical protein
MRRCRWNSGNRKECAEIAAEAVPVVALKLNTLPSESVALFFVAGRASCDQVCHLDGGPADRESHHVVDVGVHALSRRMRAPLWHVMSGRKRELDRAEPPDQFDHNRRDNTASAVMTSPVIPKVDVGRNWLGHWNARYPWRLVYRGACAATFTWDWIRDRQLPKFGARSFNVRREQLVDGACEDQGIFHKTRSFCFALSVLPIQRSLLWSRRPRRARNQVLQHCGLAE